MYNCWRILNVSYPTTQENLALEESLFQNAQHQTRPTVRFWVNHPSVIIGRFQDPNLEVDMELCRKQGITVARRLTGGGTVYHDEGNLNFTVLCAREHDSLDSIQTRNCSLIVNALHDIGVPGELIPPNSVHVAGRKISGAAAALSKSAVLWHASILISAKTDRLNETLAPSRHAEKSRFIRSRWHPVTTLNEHSSRQVNVNEVSLQLLRSTRKLFGIELESGELTEAERKLARTLYVRKYSKPNWNLEGHAEQ